MFWFFIAALAGCSDQNAQVENAVDENPTFDSNTVITSDTIPEILHLDNPELDSIPIAMDSVGPTILPKDTNYKKPSGVRN